MRQARTVDQAQADTLALLPDGFASTHSADDYLGARFRSLANEISNVETSALALLPEVIDPRSATDLLTDWETEMDTAADLGDPANFSTATRTGLVFALLTEGVPVCVRRGRPHSRVDGDDPVSEIRIKRGASLNLLPQFMRSDGREADVTHMVLKSEVRDPQDCLIDTLPLVKLPELDLGERHGNGHQSMAYWPAALRPDHRRRRRRTGHLFRNLRHPSGSIGDPAMTMSVRITQCDTPLPRPSLTMTNIVAMPGGRTTATPLYAPRNVVNNVKPGAAVILQLLPIGQMTVFNRCGTGQALTVYPIVGMKIEGNGPNIPVTIADGDQVTFTWDGTITWLVS